MNIGIVSPISLERNSLKQLLLGLGHRVFIIEAAKEIADDVFNQIDVLLVSDLVLVQKNEDKPVRNYLSRSSEQTTPVVVIIDQTAPDLENIVKNIGADDFLIRPLNRFILDARLKLVQTRLKKQQQNEALLRKDRDWLETIRQASELVTQTRTLENSFAPVAHHLQKVIPLNQFVISLDEDSGIHYEVVELDGESDEQTHFTVQLSKDQACHERQACGRGQKIICDAVNDQDERLAQGMKSCVCLGLYEGECRLGALSLSSHQANAFNESQMPHLESLALQVAHTVTNIQRYQQMTSEAKRLATIIREVHHRIKNNLQGIIGLFGRHREDKPELAPVLNSAVSQLYAVAEVHNLLSHHIQETVDWHALIQSICEVSNHLSHHRVEHVLTASTAGLKVVASEAVPMALALNELIQNAISHGYPDGVPGIIRVRAELAPGEQGVRLTIANNGIAPSRNPREEPGNGLDLVRSLLPAEARFRLHREQDWTIAETIYPAEVLMNKNLEESV